MTVLPELPVDCRGEILVDLDAIRANVTRLHEAAAGAAVMVVVKADGYGHGMLPVARAAREAGASWLGVAVVDEAVALREAGDTGRLLCWLSVPGEDLTRAVTLGVDLTAYSTAEIAQVVSAAERAGRAARLQLKIDTGLHRGGAPLSEWPGVLEAAAQAQADGAVEVTGVWSHLACSDDPDHPANDAQEAAFRSAVARVSAAGLTPEVVHLANSAAALTRPSARFDLVRCGLAAYGLSPAPTVGTSADFGLVPAMTVRARLALVKPVAAGQSVSYGHTWTASRDSVVGVVPFGYADGIPRHGSSAAPVSIAGRRTTIVGRVCMDQVVVDLGEAGAAGAPGDEVVLVGADGPTAQEWADACGTISYEIVTRFGGRFRRRHVGAHA